MLFSTRLDGGYCLSHVIKLHYHKIKKIQVHLQKAPTVMLILSEENPDPSIFFVCLYKEIMHTFVWTFRWKEGRTKRAARHILLNFNTRSFKPNHPNQVYLAQIYILAALNVVFVHIIILATSFDLTIPEVKDFAYCYSLINLFFTFITFSLNLTIVIK